MTIVFDLDDTLYDEIDFVKSGFKEVARYLGNIQYYSYMIDDFMQNGSGKIFNNIIDKFNLNISLQKIIEIYRFHYPDIKLRDDARDILSYYKGKRVALITDGHYIMQKNKYFNLKLDNIMQYSIFTDFFRLSKPNEKPFIMIMEKFKDSDYVYIGDNPRKDFIAPKKLNWLTIRYKNSNGIYRDIENNADYEIEDLNEIKGIL